MCKPLLIERAGSLNDLCYLIFRLEMFYSTSLVHCMSVSGVCSHVFNLTLLLVCSVFRWNWYTLCVFFPGGRKRRVWAKRRRRQSGTKSSLKTLPKEDDSDDACEKSSSVFVFRSQSPSAIKLIPPHSSVSRFDFVLREQWRGRLWPWIFK